MFEEAVKTGIGKNGYIAKRFKLLTQCHQCMFNMDQGASGDLIPQVPHFGLDVKKVPVKPKPVVEAPKAKKKKSDGSWW